MSADGRIASQFGATLAEIGRKLAEDPERNAAELRQGLRELERIAEVSDDHHIVLQSYLLSFFVDDVWENIGMVSSTVTSDDDKEETLQNIGERLTEVGNYVESDQYGQCYETYADLVHRYLDDIDRIREGRPR